MQPFDQRNRILIAMDKVIDLFIVLNIVAISTLVCAQVVMRYVLRMPLLGIEELCYFPTMWLYLGGAVKAASEKGQLVARVLELFIKKQKSIYLLRAVAAVGACAILCWLTYWGYDLLRYSLRMEKLTDTLFIPWLLIEGTAFFAMGLMTFYTLIEIMEYFAAYSRTDSVAEKIAEEVQA